MKLSIIIPTYNEAESIGVTLERLAHLRGDFEIIVVDGGSMDATVERVRECEVKVIASDERGRGAQMHAGACAAGGDVLWFLHADTLPPRDAVERIIAALDEPEIVGGNCVICFDGESRVAKFMTWLYPRLRRIGLCYGDSAIFVRRDVYHRVGGFQPYPIFEDLDFVWRVRQIGSMVYLPVTVVTSSRRFEGRNFPLTFARWAWLQILFWCGVSPHRLGGWYHPVRAAKANHRQSLK
ncbi:MAG: TIGR04283 family arsenosugar biosynthesis glycosyltransferase [Pyrinomonadaceae bacterium MAG19_C2-C3]|nr:TIGR04283 family arsenosugar biosynthesis glycosyltransferase [Pyrinomonadaceae bacterium MAG19_C2-C3]